MNFLGLWRLWNYLFGFHYVTYKFGYSMSVGRVIELHGTLFIHICCTGYIPIESIDMKIYPLTMSVDDFNRLIDRNNK